MSKYSNIRTNGYASKKEAARANELRVMQHAGLVFNVREQVRYELIPKKMKSDGTWENAMFYVADFVYQDEHGNEIVEDCKGFKTDVYKIKRKLMLFRHGITIKET